MSQIDCLNQGKSIQYEERLICFIDLLGFKSAVDASKADTQTLSALYEALYELEGGRLVTLLHGSVPVLTKNGELTSTQATETVHIAQKNWPIVATQFSDSFVLSCPADNQGSCRMLLQAIDRLQNIFFKYLGMLMRGGVSKGELIHEQGGPLFGPAMNAAYALESGSAIYPRVLFDGEAAKHVGKTWGDGPSPVFTTFDGHQALDLISCLAFKNQQEPQDWAAFNAQLTEIEQNIQRNSSFALPKVHYLKDRLYQHWRLGQQ